VKITGEAYALGYSKSTSKALNAAASDMETAYEDAKGRRVEVRAKLDLGGGTLGGEYGGKRNPLTPGVYAFSSDVNIGNDIYFDFGKDEDSVFIIQIKGNLEQSAKTKVVLADGALANNIFWQVEGSVVVSTGAEMKGILLAKTAVDFKTGSLLVGKVLSQTECSLESASVKNPRTNTNLRKKGGK
jgi:hypothetical protein